MIKHHCIVQQLTHNPPGLDLEARQPGAERNTWARCEKMISGSCSTHKHGRSSSEFKTRDADFQNMWRYNNIHGSSMVLRRKMQLAFPFSANRPQYIDRPTFRNRCSGPTRGGFASQGCAGKLNVSVSEIQLGATTVERRSWR